MSVAFLLGCVDAAKNCTAARFLDGSLTQRLLLFRLLTLFRCESWISDVFPTISVGKVSTFQNALTHFVPASHATATMGDPHRASEIPDASADGNIFDGTEDEWWEQVCVSMRNRENRQLSQFEDNVDASSDGSSDELDDLSANEENVDDEASPPEHSDVEDGDDERGSSAEESDDSSQLSSCGENHGAAVFDNAKEEDGDDDGIPRLTRFSNRPLNRARVDSADSNGFPFPSQRTDGAGSDGRSPRPSVPDAGSQRPRKFKWQKILTDSEGLKGSVWSPAQMETTRESPPNSYQHPVDDVLILVGGVNGGVEGPAGLYQQLHRLSRQTGSPLSGWSVLSLNTGHCLDDAIPVICAGIRWVLRHYPRSKGHVFLVGCSMGSSTVIAAATLFGRDVIAGLCILCGQGSHHQNLASKALAKTPVLLIHGANDVILPVLSSKLLCESALASGASVDVYLLRQRPAHVDKDTLTVDTTGNLFLKYHHMWHERFVVASLIVRWLKEHRQRNATMDHVNLGRSTSKSAVPNTSTRPQRRVQYSSLNVIDVEGALESRLAFETPRGPVLLEDKSRRSVSEGSSSSGSDSEGAGPDARALTSQPQWESVTSPSTRLILFERTWSRTLKHARRLMKFGTM